MTPAAMTLLEQHRCPGNIGAAQRDRARHAAARGRADGDGGSLGDRAQRVVPAVPLPPGGVSLEDVERQLLVQALERAAGNQTRAGQLLGINRDQVRCGSRGSECPGRARTAPACSGDLKDARGPRSRRPHLMSAAGPSAPNDRLAACPLTRGCPSRARIYDFELPVLALCAFPLRDRAPRATRTQPDRFWLKGIRHARQPMSRAAEATIPDGLQDHCGRGGAIHVRPPAGFSAERAPSRAGVCRTITSAISAWKLSSPAGAYANTAS